MRGNSMANGNSFALGNTHMNGPGTGPLAQGWDIRPLASIWETCEGRDYR